MLAGMKLDRLPPRDKKGNLHVVVESPRGSRVKLAYDPELGCVTLSRPLPLGVVYPFDWGFVPGTRAADGDPVDALVLLDVPTFPGVVIACEPIGVLQVEQNKKSGSGRERNDRLLVVPVKAPRFDGLRDARELPDRAREEIEAFFRTAVLFEDKDLTLLGWGGPDEAERLVDEGTRAQKDRAA